MKTKKLISIALSLTIILSSIGIGISAYADDIESDNIESFVDKVTEIISTYDADKKFVVSPEEPEIVEQNDDPTVWEPTIFEESEETENVSEPNFQSCRLIVKQSKRFDDKNATAVADGFGDYHIVQFENEKDTEEAYYEYLNDKNVSSVSVDTIMAVDTDARPETTPSPTITKEDLTDNWYTYSTGMQEFISRRAELWNNPNLPEIKIGVLDTGVNLEHEYLQGRMFKTDFNPFSDSDETDDTVGHGTMVSSVIAANTPNNVKIGVYKVISNSSVTSLSALFAGLTQAYADGCSVLNCSFRLSGDYSSENPTLQSILKDLREKGCFISVGAGNDSTHMDYGRWYFTKSNYIFCVGGSTEYNIPYQGTNYGGTVKLLAPATNIPVARFDGTYTSATGTSFSAPFICSVYAMLQIVYPNTSLDERERMLIGSTVDHDTPYSTGYFGSGIIDVLKLFDMVKLDAPIITVTSPSECYGEDKYVGPVTIEITADDGCDIYYTMDSSYPSPENGTLYTEPIVFENDFWRFRAVAINKNGERSSFSTKMVHSAKVGTDDMFTINNDGMITSYTGDLIYLKIPETINGITVEDIDQYVFKNAICTGVILPDTITDLGIKNEHYIDELDTGYNEFYISLAFADNQSIKYVTGRNLRCIRTEAFEDMGALREIDFPNLEKIEAHAFYRTHLWGAVLPKLQTVEMYAFNSMLREFFAANLKETGYAAFNYCIRLTRLEIPQSDIIHSYTVNEFYNNDCRDVFFDCHYLQNLQLDSIKNLSYSYGSSAFTKCAVKRLELSSAESIDSLPGNYKVYGNNLYGDQKISVSLVFPSTLTNIDTYEIERHFFMDKKDYYDYTEYVVYGSGSNKYLIDWADKIDAKFVALSEQTAIVEDVYPIYDRFSNEQLFFDCYGFNKQYQWYGSYINDTKNGIVLDGATDEEFSPEDYPYFPYYYCVMTSTDKYSDGTVAEELIVYSTVCENLLYVSEEEPDEPDTTDPTEPSTEPSTEPTKPSTTTPTESTTNSTTTEKTVSENETTTKNSASVSETTTQTVNQNTSKTSPNTGTDNNYIPFIAGFAVVFIIAISTVGSKRKRHCNIKK